MNKYLHMVVIYLGLVAGANAGWLQDNLTTVSNGSGAFSTSSGTTYSGGSASVGIPHKTYQLYSIDPPSISAGCNGIDIHLGGMSFISKEEALVMLRAIAQGTLTMSFLMAFKQACPGCASALKTAQEWAAKANMGGINTCQLSTKLAGNIVGEKEDAKNGACGTISAEKNGSTSFLSAFSSPDSDCKKSAEKAMTVLNEEYCDDTTKKCEDLGLAEIVGVSTYEYLTTLNILNVTEDEDHFAIMELMLSLYGTFDNGWEKNPTLSMEDVTNLLACGAEESGFNNTTDLGKEVKKSISAQCIIWWTEAEDKSAIVCVDGDRGPCSITESLTVADWATKRATGLAKIGIAPGGIASAFVNTLESAAFKIKNQSETALTCTEAVMIGSAPFPLYRLINLSVYFDSGLIANVLGESIWTISEDMSVEAAKNISDMISMVRNVMTDQSKGTAEQPPTKVVAMIRNAANQNRTVSAEAVVSKGAKDRMYELITANIVSLEKAVMREKSANLIMSTK